MKSFLLCLLLLTISGSAIAQKDKPDGLPPHEARVDKKVEREILKAETQLGQAIVRRDAATLDRLLADYYADGAEGGESATAKAATLTRCRSGTLQYYRIQSEQKLTFHSGIVEIEGISKGRQRIVRDMVTDKDDESPVRVRRIWTKKNGSWLLIAQTIKPIERRPDSKR